PRRSAFANTNEACTSAPGGIRIGTSRPIGTPRTPTRISGSGSTRRRPRWQRSPSSRAQRWIDDPSLLLVELLPGVLKSGGDGLELDVGELTADPAHLAQVLVLHDVAGVRIDRNRAARAVRVPVVLEHLHRLVGVELALLRLDRLEHHVHAVPGADGDEVRRAAGAVFL